MGILWSELGLGGVSISVVALVLFLFFGWIGVDSDTGRCIEDAGFRWIIPRSRYLDGRHDEMGRLDGGL